MRTPLPWLASAQEELFELEQEHAQRGLDPESAYRLLVLCARLEQAHANGLEVMLPLGGRELVTRYATLAAQPESHRLLSRLEELLRSDDDPFGELLDVLLAVDDAASVGDAAGHVEAARELVQTAEAYVSLAPERVGALGELADNRLGTLPGNASIRWLWDSLSQAAVQAAVEALPPTLPAPASLHRQRLLKKLRARTPRIEEEISRAPPLDLLRRAAAAGVSEASEVVFEGRAVDLFFEGEVLHLQVALPAGSRLTGEVELHLESRERTALWKLPIQRSSKQVVITSLGTLDELRGRLRREGLLDELRWIVVLSLEEVDP